MTVKRSPRWLGRRDGVRGEAVVPSREAARSHSRGRSRGDGECGTGPLARYRLAPRRREITFGRQGTRESAGLTTAKASSAASEDAAVREPGNNDDLHPTAVRSRSSPLGSSSGPVFDWSTSTAGWTCVRGLSECAPKSTGSRRTCVLGCVRGESETKGMPAGRVGPEQGCPTDERRPSGRSCDERVRPARRRDRVAGTDRTVGVERDRHADGLKSPVRSSASGGARDCRARRPHVRLTPAVARGGRGARVPRGSGREARRSGGEVATVRAARVCRGDPQADPRPAGDLAPTRMHGSRSCRGHWRGSTTLSCSATSPRSCRGHWRGSTTFSRSATSPRSPIALVWFDE